MADGGAARRGQPSRPTARRRPSVNRVLRRGFSGSFLEDASVSPAAARTCKPARFDTFDPLGSVKQGLCAGAGQVLDRFDWRVFYPYHYTEPMREHDEFPDAITRHHWAASWWKGGGV